LTAVGAKNDIRLGIDVTYELFKTNRFKLFRGSCKYTIDEIEMYRWPDDDDQAGPNKDVKERNPVKQNDHAMDALRYCSVETYTPMDLKPVIISDTLKKKRRETDQHRIERLKRRPKKMWENFS
jgi:hypothetical protein